MKLPRSSAYPLFLAVTTGALLPITAQATIYTWDNDSTDGDWDTAVNWDPASVPGEQDQAIIDNGDTVSKTGDLILRDKKETLDDGLRLLDGTLSVSGNFTTTTQGGSGSSIKSDLGVSGGATTGTFDVGGTLRIGNTNSGSSSVASLNIFEGSLVSVGTFQGDISPSTSGSATGGWKVNVLGGTLTADLFDWGDHSSSTDPDPTANLILGSTDSDIGGTVIIGVMSADWTMRAGQYALFNDTLASLTFGKTNYATITDVEYLIDNDFIRMDDSITQSFTITDNGSSWTVAIPEPSSYSLLIGLIALPIVLVRRRK
tara:strand:+ start:14601 stop:15548 length:948 start_codon:yes stop_codon:yes gene_type:complete